MNDSAAGHNQGCKGVRGVRLAQGNASRLFRILLFMLNIVTIGSLLVDDFGELILYLLAIFCAVMATCAVTVFILTQRKNVK